MSFGNDVNEILETQSCVPRLDTDRYRHHLADYKLTDAQAGELLATLWNIVLAAIELGANVDIEQVLTESCPLEKGAPTAPVGVKSNHPPSETENVNAASCSTGKDRDGD